MSLLKSSDDVNHRYTFDAAGVAASGLKIAPGRILVLYNKALRKITSVQTQGNDLIVDTDYAPLTDAIVNGTISWDVGVIFHPTRIKSVSVNGQAVRVATDGTIHFQVKNGPFTYDLTLKLQGDTAGVDFSVTKSLGSNASAKLTAEGTVQRFRTRDTITIKNNQLQQFDHNLDKMRGNLTLGLVMAASGQDFVNLELPVVLIRYPVLLGGIPVILTIRVQFVVQASVPVSGSAQVQTTFTYDSDLGYRYAGSQVQVTGQLGNIVFDKGVTQTGAPGPIAANFGIGFPRVEVGIFGETIAPWAQTAFLVGGTYTMLPPCQTADASFIGSAGLNLNFFGVTADLGSKTLFRMDRKLLRAGQCPAVAALAH